MTIHEDLGVALFDPLEYGVAERDVGHKVTITHVAVVKSSCSQKSVFPIAIDETLCEESRVILCRGNVISAGSDRGR